MDNKLALSIQETAKALGLSHATVRTMIASGQLHAVRVGTGHGKYIVPREALNDLLKVRVA